MKTQQELLEQMRNALDFETDGCVQTAAMLNLQERREELIELRRLAEIGRATKMAFENGYSLMKDEGDFVDEDDSIETYYEFDYKTIANNASELLDWAKEQANENTSI